jgi:hypothetical protein
MLRIILVAAMLLMCGVFALGLAVKGKAEKEPTDAVVRKRDEFSKLPPPVPAAELPPLVQEVNRRNAAITSMACDDVEMRVWLRGHRYRLTGEIYYEKPKNFRMEISSVLGKEVDVGANAEAFWYWSRRDPEPGLHWAAHADLSKTRLKTPFNPAFLRATLGLEVFPSENVRVAERGTDLMLTYPRVGANGEALLFSVFLDKQQRRVSGYVVTDATGAAVAACEIQAYSGLLPSKILYNWCAEGRVMLMTLPNARANAAIPAGVWRMPNYTPKINMADGAK